MNNPPLADIEDLATRLGQAISGLELGRAMSAIDDASALVRSVAKTTWIDENGDLETVPDDVITVTLAVARRVYENPKGLIAEATGPFSESRPDEAGQALYLTKTERAILGEYRPTTNTGLWALSTSRTDSAADNTPLDLTQFETETGAPVFDAIPTRGPW